MTFEKRRALLVAAACLALSGCRGAEAELPPQAALPGPTPVAAPNEPAGPADPDVAATVKTVIESAHHPELTWPDLP